MVNFIRYGLTKAVRIASQAWITKCKILAHSGIRTRDLPLTKRTRYNWVTRTDVCRVVKSLSGFTYSSSDIVQITDFWDFRHEYCKGKSETCTQFETSFVVTKNIKIGFRPAAPVKNQHKMHYHREFTRKRDVTLADPRRKMGCSLGYKYLSWKFLLQIFFILHQLYFHANKVKLIAFLKICLF